MSTKKKAPVKRTKRNAKGRRKSRVSINQPPKQNKGDLFGFMAGRLEVVGDIESPLADWKYWNPAKNLEK
jgi:hypothetical protein